MQTYFKTMGPTKKSNYDETDLPAEDEEIFMFSRPPLPDSLELLDNDKMNRSRTIYITLFDTRKLNHLFYQFDDKNDGSEALVQIIGKAEELVTMFVIATCININQ